MHSLYSFFQLLTLSLLCVSRCFSCCFYQFTKDDLEMSFLELSKPAITSNSPTTPLVSMSLLSRSISSSHILYSLASHGLCPAPNVFIVAWDDADKILIWCLLVISSFHVTVECNSNVMLKR